MSPKVTVLLAVRDGERYLSGAIDSVLRQSFTDFELLVVDDGSEDGTPRLLESVRDQRLRVLRNERSLGQVHSLNRGLREARGEYVARLDHDDACLPDRLVRQVAVLDAEPRVAVVGSWATLVDEDDRILGHARQSIRDYVEFVYWNLVAWVLIPHPAATFRRATVLELGGYDEALGPSEDKDLWRKLALRRLEGRIVELELIRYRLHTGQLSRVFRERQRRHDQSSHEAFLRALADDVDAHRLRLLLTGDPAFFAVPDARATPPDLDRLLAGAAARLWLDEAERAKLETLVRGRIAQVARRGWRGGTRAWWRASPPLAVYGLRRRGLAAAMDAAVYGATLAAAPILSPADRMLRGVLRSAAKAPGVRSLEARARRSRVARRIYSWVIGRD